jgi:hypothetical protein
MDKGRIIGVLSVGKPNLAMAPVIKRSERRILWAGGVRIAHQLTDREIDPPDDAAADQQRNAQQGAAGPSVNPTWRWRRSLSAASGGSSGPAAPCWALRC